MWSGQDKVWMHYLNDIIAADVASAVFLSSYMRHALRGRTHAAYHEVADLQRYKLHRLPKKVHNALISRAHLPFVFILGKN
jgi:hypothetical protein